jgi:hypothetical protein
MFAADIRLQWKRHFFGSLAPRRGIVGHLAPVAPICLQWLGQDQMINFTVLAFLWYNLKDIFPSKHRSEITLCRLFD